MHQTIATLYCNMTMHTIYSICQWHIMPYPNTNWNVVLEIKHKICYYCQWLKASNIWPFDGFSMWQLKNVSITICSTWYVHLVCPKKSWKAKSLPRTQVSPVAKSLAHMTLPSLGWFQHIDCNHVPVASAPIGKGRAVVVIAMSSVGLLVIVNAVVQ